MNLYDQLINLQEVPQAFEKWQTYREEMTTYLIEQSYGDREIALFGAGRCNDIDLKMLTSYFEKVYLLDRDAKSLLAALRNYHLEQNPRIAVQDIDFIGLKSNDYRRYADVIIEKVKEKGKAIQTHELAQTALGLIHEFEITMKNHKIALQQYDNVAAIGVHSQLLSMLEWIYSVVLQTIEKDESSVRQKIISLNDFCAARFNNILLQTARYHVIIGCEEKRLGREGSIQGAHQGMADLESRHQQQKIRILDERYFIWPFNEAEGKNYLMKCECIMNY